MSQGLTYLASPYTHADEAVMQARFEAACIANGQLMALGYYVYSPIAHCHPVAERCSLPTTWEYWEGFDRAMMGACCRLLVLRLDGWDKSKGVTAEIAIAGELGIPVQYLDMPDSFVPPPPRTCSPCGWASAHRVDPVGTVTADASVEAIKYV